MAKPQPQLDAPDTPAPLAPAVADAVEAWFVAHFHDLGPRLDTPLYNHVHAAKHDLLARLAPHCPA